MTVLYTICTLVINTITIRWISICSLSDLGVSSNLNCFLYRSNWALLYPKEANNPSWDHLSLHFKARLSVKSLLWKSVVIYIEIRSNYHNKNSELRLALKERLRGTRKCPVVWKLTWGTGWWSQIFPGLSCRSLSLLLRIELFLFQTVFAFPPVLCFVDRVVSTSVRSS